MRFWDSLAKPRCRGVRSWCPRGPGRTTSGAWKYSLDVQPIYRNVEWHQDLHECPLQVGCPGSKVAIIVAGASVSPRGDPQTRWMGSARAPRTGHER
eukprot:8566738-Pyramimonas_sp.AAC.1